MATTSNTFTGDGSTTNYSFTFEYLEQDEVKVTLTGVPTTAFTFANATTISFNSAPANGTEIRIYRDTDIDTLKATFFPGSAIKAEDLNNNFTQNNFVVQELQNSTWDVDLQTIKSNETWVSSDDQIATTAAMDQRFQDEAAETILSTETWVADDDHIATTQAIEDRIDEVITNDIGTDGTGITVTDDGDGTITLGLAANSIDFDRIKNVDIITEAEQDAGSPAEADTNLFTSLAAAKRFDTIVDTAAQSTSVNWEVGKTWLQNDSEKTVRIWDGSAWVAVASGGSFTTLSKVVYVDSVNGDDSLEGHRISNPKKTIKAAIEQINSETDAVGDGSVVIVAPGVYQEAAPIDIQKKNVSIIGQALRSCIVHPTVATQENTLFRLNSGSYIANLTLTGVKASGTRGGNSLDTDATYGLPTNQGWNFAFYPNATIVKSPYIANCTNFSDSEIDNSNLNAFNPAGGLGGDTDSAPTGGGILIDGAAVNSNSPLRSMVCDSYTHVGLDGPGIFVTNNGYCQATSSYAFFTHYHIKALNGGQANLAASTTDFGRYGLIAQGRSSSAIFTATTTVNASSGATTFTIGAPSAGANWFGSATRPQSNMVVDIGGNTYSIIGATANGSGWDVEISRPDPNNLSTNLGLNGAVNSGSAVSFYLRSMIASSGHTMEYVGSGTNYSALPENGGVPIEANEIIELNNGKVWAATTNHQGKFTVGPTFNVDQVTGYVNIANGAIGIEKLIEDLDLNSFTLSDSTGDVTIDDQMDMNTHKIVNVVDPTNAQDAATKAYADTKLPLAGGTMTGNIAMAGSQTVDGRDLSVDGAKLDGIESGADVTDSANVDAAGAVMNSDTTTASMSFVVDEDAMTSNSDTKVPTQQSVKAYADTKLPLAGGTMTGNLTMNAQSDVRFADADSSNYVALQAPTTIGTNYTLTLPSSVGGAGEALITDASGNLSWSSNVTTTVDQLIEGDTKVEAVDTGANGEIQFTTDGTRAMTIESNQRVGIGTSSPLYKLDVNSGSDDVALRLASSDANCFIDYRDGTTTAGYVRTGAVGDNLVLWAGNSERLRIDSSGNVGIGTTSPEARLTISPGTNSTTAIGGRNINYGANLIASSGRTGYLVRVGNNYTTDNDNAGFQWLYPFDTGGDNDYKVFRSAVGSTLVDKFWVNQAGGAYFADNVGIGTTSPANLLHVAGVSEFRTSSSSAISLHNGTEYYGFIGNSSGDLVINAGGTNDTLALQTNGTERARIDSSGRLLVGTSSSLDFGSQTQVAGTGANFEVFRFSSINGNVGASVDFARSGSFTVGTLAAVSPSQGLGIMRFRGAGDASTWLTGAQIEATVESGTVSNTSMPTRLVFSTTADGASSPTERMRIDSSGRLLVGTTTPPASANNAGGNLFCLSASQTLFRSSPDGNSQYIEFVKQRASGTIVNDNDWLGQIIFEGHDGTNPIKAAQIQAAVDGTPGTNDMPGRLMFLTTANGASSPTERMRIDSAGDTTFYSGTSGVYKLIDWADAVLYSFRTGTGIENHIRFYNANGQVGRIYTNGSATVYATSSDYRLKENVTPVTDGIARLQQLKPSRFNFIADPDTIVDGFLAHEVQDIVPEAIGGDKDAVDENGDPEYQSIDQSKLVPLLTAALQEAVAKIEALETRIAALEAN